MATMAPVLVDWRVSEPHEDEKLRRWASTRVFLKLGLLKRTKPVIFGLTAERANQLQEECNEWRVEGGPVRRLDP